MEGNFRHQMGENKSDNTPILQSKLICRNCGSDEPGEGSKCHHCHFPLARVKVLLKAERHETPGPQQSVIHSPAKHP